MARRIVAGQPVFLSTAPAKAADRRLALAAAVTSLLIFVALVPFARRPLPELPAFIPAYEAALAISDLITGAILFIQFNILRSRAMLALAAGYLFTALIVIPHCLTFPGVFSPTGLLGAGPQSTAWLYTLWHGGFPLAVIAYRTLGGQTNSPGASKWAGAAVVLATIGAVVGAVVGATTLVTAGKAILPQLMIGNSYAPFLAVAVSIVWIFCLLALALLWRRRPHTVLDLWLMVVMCAWLCDVALSALLNNARFDLGFYAGRGYGLLAATFVLIVLLLETGTLYAQLAAMFESEHHERRREAEERRRIFETSLDQILVVDRQGTLLRVSPSSTAILGYQPAEMVGRNAADFVHADDLDPIRKQMRRARHGHPIRNFPTRYIHKDGHLVTLAWSSVWSEPEQRHFFIGRDVTEQKRIERMKDEFVATVSHEFRTPVTTIAGPLALLVGGAAGDLPQQARRLISMAHDNSKRLARLVEDMLEIEEIESETTSFNFQRHQVKYLVEQAIADNQAFADKFGVAVRLEAGAGLAELTVHTDRSRFVRVLANLLSNAVKFSPPGEPVVVSIELHDDRLRIAVRDYGPGIPEEFKSLVFEKFAQVDATDARQKGGTGLGLNIVQQTMMHLGGRVGHRPAPHRGTIFYVDVPRWAAPSPRHASGLRPAETPLPN